MAGLPFETHHQLLKTCDVYAGYKAAGYSKYLVSMSDIIIHMGEESFDELGLKAAHR